MSEARGWRRVLRAARRLVDHGRRAVHAARRSGPGRYPGSVTGIELGADGAIVIEGFAHVPGETVEAVVVSVSDAVIGAASVDVATPDLALARADETGAGRAGWRLVVPRAVVPAGTVSIGAVALTRSGLAEALDPVMWTMPGAPPPAVLARGPVPVTGFIEAPQVSSHETGATIEVTGWVDPARLIDRVEVFADASPVGRARLFSGPRPDIGDRFADPTAALAGFWHLFEVDAPPGATVRVGVEAITRNGVVVLGQREVTIPPPPLLEEPDRAWISALSARAAMAAETHVPEDGVNLLVVAHDLRLGGAQLWLQEILRRLLGEPDVACTVMAPRDGPLRRELEASGARVHLIGPFPSSAGAYEAMAREMTHVAAADGCNVALVNSIGAFIGADVATRCGIPSVLAIHEHYSLNAFLHFAFGGAQPDTHVRAHARQAVDQASAVGFVANATRELWSHDAPAARRERFVLVEYGIPLAAFKAPPEQRSHLRAAHGFAGEDRVLLCVGSVEARKGQSNLVLALDRIAADHPEAQLVLLGTEPTPYTAALARLLDGLGLERRVRMVDATIEVAKWYAMADALVLASDAESLPRVIIEAMAAGIPVLATQVGGVTELVRDRDTGLVCEPRDVGELADGLVRLLTLPDDDRRALVDHAASLIEARRDVDRYTAAFSHLVRELAKDPAVSPRAVLNIQ
ncbi:MAG: glycosyltransferase family 4 protein [Acidimicrobiia bacterium]